MTRKESREIAFTILFEYSFDQSSGIIEHYECAIQERDVEDNAFVRTLLGGVEKHIADIDTAIETYSEKWKRTRIGQVTMAILRLATFEMLYLDDVPLRVSLNEAIELAKKFDDEKAYGFVNGVLNALMHDQRAVGEQ